MIFSYVVNSDAEFTAAERNSLAFLSVGAFVLIPVILIYTAFSYYVFRGKVANGSGYH